MRTSVIIPAHKDERHVGRTVEGVLRQSVTDWELIVVHPRSANGSSDVAQGRARPDPRLRLTQQPDVGLAAARNWGFAQSSACAEYVAFLDAADVWEE